MPRIAFVLMLFSPLTALAVDGRARTSFSVDGTLAEVAHKFDTEQSLRRVLQSQGVELLDYNVSRRQFSLRTQSLDADLLLKVLARRFSRFPGDIKQTVQIGAKQARLEFILLQPLGLLAEQRYMFDFFAEEQTTKIDVEIYTRVYVPQSRWRCVQRMIHRIGNRRVAQEQRRQIINLQHEMEQIIAADRPAGAKSILLP